jgi:hypothetical protein
LNAFSKHKSSLAGWRNLAALAREALSLLESASLGKGKPQETLHLQKEAVIRQPVFFET